MNLKGIKANFLGDSITEGHGVADTEHNIYWQRLGEACGLAEYRGYGIGGTRIAVQHTESENHYRTANLFRTGCRSDRGVWRNQ